MQNVQLVRARLAKGLDLSLRQFLSWLSCVEGNRPETDQLRHALQRIDKPEPELIALLTESVLDHLGYHTQVNGMQTNGNASMSKARRIAAKL